MRNAGSVLGKRASEGMPGKPIASDADALKLAAVRATVRRVSPTRSSFRRRSEIARW
jgi:hypothetical protein